MVDTSKKVTTLSPEYWGEEGEPLDEWAKPIVARGKRPAFEMEQVIHTPHIGASTVEAQARAGTPRRTGAQMGKLAGWDKAKFAEA